MFPFNQRVISCKYWVVEVHQVALCFRVPSTSWYPHHSIYIYRMTKSVSPPKILGPKATTKVIVTNHQALVMIQMNKSTSWNFVILTNFDKSSYVRKTWLNSLTRHRKATSLPPSLSFSVNNHLCRTYLVDLMEIDGVSCLFLTINRTLWLLYGYYRVKGLKKVLHHLCGMYLVD